MLNSDEIAYWNGEAGSLWSIFQERIDRAFAPLSAAGLAAANVQSGQTVLDIGCGCGTTLLELAGAVDANGSVVGADVSQPMLAVAERRARAAGLTNVRCVLADASTYAFGENAFDIVFSRFGVMFFDDPVRAFANVRQSLRPGGRLVFVCWREFAANPWFRVPVEAVRHHVTAQPPSDPNAPGPLAFADPARVRKILQQAGFDAITLEKFDADLSLGTRASATELLTNIGPTESLLRGADDAARAKSKLAVEVALREHETNGDVFLGAAVWIVTARPEARPVHS